MLKDGLGSSGTRLMVFIEGLAASEHARWSGVMRKIKRSFWYLERHAVADCLCMVFNYSNSVVSSTTVNLEATSMPDVYLLRCDRDKRLTVAVCMYV
jgi:hypothetical protein